MMKLWEFEKAPKKYRELSNNGGDEDWVLFIPNRILENWSYGDGEILIPYWIERMDTCHEPQRIKLKEGLIIIGAHA